MFIILLYLFLALPSKAMHEEEFELDDFNIHKLYEAKNINLFIKYMDDFDVDEANKFGMRVAHLAARDGNILWLAALRCANADLEAPSNGRNVHWTPAQWAHAAGHRKALTLLLHYRYDENRSKK
jgi:hypothetical protein